MAAEFGNRGRVVLVLTGGATMSALCGQRESLPSEGPSEPAALQFVGVADAEALGRQLAQLGTHVVGVVVNPEYAAPDDRAALNVAVQLHRLGRELRVVLLADATAGAMHAVRRLAACVKCELIVRGVDPSPRWSAHEDSLAISRAKSQAVVGQLARLPLRVRLAWVESVTDDSRTTVKRVAACVGVHRRTLERAHKEAGVWSPARILRALLVADDLGASSMLPVVASDLLRDARAEAMRRSG